MRKVASMFFWASLYFMFVQPVRGEDLRSMINSWMSPKAESLQMDTNIPALYYDRVGDRYEFHAFLKGNVPPAPTPEVELRFNYFDKANNAFVPSGKDNSKLSVTPNDYTVSHLQGAGPRQLRDAGGKLVQVDGELTEIRFSVPANQFSGLTPSDPKLTSGAMLLNFPGENSPRFARAFFSYPEEPQRYVPEFKPTPNKLHVPLLLFADFLGDQSPRQFVEDAKKRFDDIWGQCNIELQVTGVMYFPISRRSQPLHPVDLSPELFYALRALRQNFPERAAAGDLVALNWRPGKPLSVANDKLDNPLRQISGISMSYEPEDNFKTETFKTEMSENKGRRFLLFDGLEPNVLAHEVGHQLVGFHHEKYRPHNLMAAGAQETSLTPGQCAKARGFIQQHYPQTSDAAGATPPGNPVNVTR